MSNQKEFDIVNECLMIIGDYHAGIWKYAGIRNLQKPHGLEIAQDVVIEHHLAVIFKTEADRNGWTLDQIQIMAIAPGEMLRKADQLDPSGMLFKLVTITYALCQFSGRTTMYARIEDLIEREAENV
jgi:hypothetical protein